MENKDVKTIIEGWIPKPISNYVKKYIEQLEKENTLLRKDMVENEISSNFKTHYNIPMMIDEMARLEDKIRAKDTTLEKAISECITTDSCLGCPCECNWELECGSDECVKRIKEWVEND